MTLIRSNPLFKTERDRFFHDRFNPRGITLDSVSRIFRQLDLLGNAVNERTGGSLQAEELYLMAIGLVTEDYASLKRVDISRLYADMEDLFLAYPPMLYDDRTLSTLEALRGTTGASFSILSNTAFIKGRTLRKVFPGLGLEGFFDFALYSDEAGMSKPNTALFRLMLDTVAVNKGVADPKGVLHIGDNPVADEEGARTAGIDAWLVNSNGRHISSLLESSILCT